MGRSSNIPRFISEKFLGALPARMLLIIRTATTWLDARVSPVHNRVTSYETVYDKVRIPQTWQSQPGCFALRRLHTD